MEHLSPGERKVAKKLILTLIEAGYHISVSDGEEVVVKHSRNIPVIHDAMGSTDADAIIFYEEELPLNKKNPRYKCLGSFELVYGNDPSGEELIADYSDNPICRKIVDKVEG